MSSRAQAALAVVLGAAGVGLTFVSGVAGAVVGFVAILMGVGGMTTLNVPETRAALIAAGLMHGAAVALASGDLALGAAVAVGTLAFRVMDEPTLRRFAGTAVAYGAVPALWLAGLAVFFASWPHGRWGWAALPTFAFGLLWTFTTVQGYQRLRVAEAKLHEGLRIGMQAPDFELPTRSGKGRVKLSDYRGDFVLLAFIRGDWCPVCQVLMRVYKKEAPRLAEHGVKLIVIGTTEGPEAEAFARELGLDYETLADPTAETAKVYGNLNGFQRQGEEVPLPVSFLIDPQGKILHASKPDSVSFFLDAQAFTRLLETPVAA